MIRNLVRNFLRRNGYDIVKTGVPYIPTSTKDGVVTVGKFPITMPGKNVQLVNYQLYPDLNGQLGRLALAISAKYPQMTTVDVGANVGDTIAVLKSAADLPVIGIEGDELSFSYLQKNITQFKDVKIVKTFLSDKTKEERVAFDKSGWNATILPVENGGEQVSFKTLDEVLSNADYNGAVIKLLKVDVEGFDTIVLRGASAVIEKDKPALFFEYNRENMIAINEDGISTVLSYRNSGYKKVIFFDHKGNLVLATDLQNEEVVRYMHDYISSSKNLLGYYDICIFHENDTDIAEKFLAIEKKYL
jgi:FkbM family methyltransferase